jgi:hypothetical protein
MLRAHATDLAHFGAWCEAHDFQPMPASQERVGAYLAAAPEGYALLTLRRQAAALTTPEIRPLVDVFGRDLAGFRDRTLLLIGSAGALRRS